MDLDKIFQDLLEADEQADRSVVVDDLRDYVHGINQKNEELSKETESLQSKAQKLQQRNGELFVRLGDRGISEEKKQEEIKQEEKYNAPIEDVITDLFG